MKEYELTISPNYVSNWGVREAIRELLQNAVDANICGYSKIIEYDNDIQTLKIKNKGAKLPASSLILGCSSKGNNDNLTGQFGEGFKLALVVLIRKGYGVNIINSDELWVPKFEFSDKFQSQVLTITVKDTKDIGYLSFEIQGITQDVYNDLLDYFPCIDDNYGETIKSDNGYILLDDRFAGKMYVEGLYIQSDSNFKYGYNFNANVVDLDRDRRAINYYELRKLTAASVVTAESCSPELFKAISNSCTDVRDIEDVIEEASDDFLQEYRDMLYEKMGLEENTLIATESVMKQLQQMDIDVPVAKGTEIESYLVAKANDKLGIIYEAKEQVNKKRDEEDAWDSVFNSRWFELKVWLGKYGKRISKEGKTEFEKILKRIEPYDLMYIREYIPAEFEWSEENFNDLREQIKNQE